MRYKSILIFAIMFAFSYLAAGQIDTPGKTGIKSIKETETTFEDGLKESVVTEFKVYDEKGRILEWKEVSLKGEIKNWEKYKYNSANELIEESFLEKNGTIKTRVVTTWQNGLKMKKDYYDGKGRLKKTKKFDYEFHGNASR
jgi:hypothetical protein